MKKKQQIVKRTPDELIKASEHLKYEISMFFQTVHLLFKMGNMKNVMSNVLIESVNMRIRILLHFLFPIDLIKKEDILAEDFFEGPEDWEKIIGKIPPELKNVKFRVAKEIVHLTYNRLNITEEDKKWNYSELVPSISEPIFQFLKHVPKENFPDADILIQGFSPNH